MPPEMLLLEYRCRKCQAIFSVESNGRSSCGYELSLVPRIGAHDSPVFHFHDCPAIKIDEGPDYGPPLEFPDPDSPVILQGRGIADLIAVFVVADPSPPG